MAVATDRGKPRAGGSAARGAGVVFAPSPVNLANLVTLGRMVMILPLVWLIGAGRVEPAFWLFVAAGASDVVDGFIAKTFNTRTQLGAYLDPLADKVLLNGIYIALGATGWLPGWLVVLVIGRDLLIIVGVVLIQRRDPLFRATPLLIGKVNTFAQIVLAACALAHAGGLVDLGELIWALVVAVACTTALSGAGYAAQALRALAAERAS